ncbi:YaaL family protein [Lentibacillus halophilus]|uniref:YaaL family protein n=1 Tax=Lentibacillus halophilus TaxID=295065 RepID=A0ABN0Z8Q6_9BACI
MRKTRKNKETDQQLLDAIIALEHEWKQIQAIVDKSIEPTEDVFFRQNLARENYLFLLREAKRRHIGIIRYTR